MSMTADSPKQRSIWRQGLSSFRQSWRDWLLLGIICAVAMVIINVALESKLIPALEAAKAVKNQKDSHAVMAAMSPYLSSITTLVAVSTLVGIIENYLFLSFFIRKELPGIATAPNAFGGLRFIGINLLLVLLALLPFVLPVLAIIAAHGAPYIVPAAVCVAVLSVTYLLVQLYMVMPLTAGNIKSPIGKGWALARGSWWRLAGNLLMLILVLMLFFFLFAIISFLLGMIGYVIANAAGAEFDKVEMAQYLKGGLNGVLQVIATAIYAAFAAAATRILYEKKRSAEPNFVLETST